MVSITFFLLSFRLKLPGRFWPGRLLADPWRIRLLLAILPFFSAVSLSVGECILLTLRLDMELERLRLEEIPRELGYGFNISRSSPGRQFSTIMASRQFTSSSAVSLCADYKESIQYISTSYTVFQQTCSEIHVQITHYNTIHKHNILH